MTGRTLLRLTPVALFIAIVFLLPFLWWPPIRSDMARVIYFSFVIVSICAVYFITPRGNEAASFRAFILPPVLFAVFLLYVILYRTMCL